MDYLGYLTHFGHKNIIKYCNRPLNHDDIMVERWHKTVKPEDTILHLGDLMVWYNMDEKWERVIRELPGDKHLILGNHDKAKKEEYEKLGFTIHDPFFAKIGGRVVYFSHYPTLLDNLSDRLSVHGHIHNNKLKQDTHNIHHNLRFRNVSVEVVDYTPVRLKDVLSNDYKIWDGVQTS